MVTSSTLTHLSEGNCKVWRDDEDVRLQDEIKLNQVPSAVALTVETTAYALLTAVELGDVKEAEMAACFLSSQENYAGGFKSTQVSQSLKSHYINLLLFILLGCWIQKYMFLNKFNLLKRSK